MTTHLVPFEGMIERDPGEFREELRSLLNRYSKENGSNTPDFVLAQLLTDTLEAYDRATAERDRWYGGVRAPGGCSQETR